MAYERWDSEKCSRLCWLKEFIYVKTKTTLWNLKINGYGPNSKSIQALICRMAIFCR